MSPLQTALYFREWDKVRRHFRAQGIDPKQTDAKRHQLHKKALGAMKSSKDFTNADLDKVLATFRAITQPANLGAQLHALDQPEIRVRNLRADCQALIARLPKVQQAESPARYADNYLNQLARSIAGVAFIDLDEKQLARVLGILRHRLGDTIKEAELAKNNCAW